MITCKTMLLACLFLLAECAWGIGLDLVAGK